MLINGQARAGFKLYKPPVALVEAESPLPQVVVYDTRNPELEQAILGDPENRELYAV